MNLFKKLFYKTYFVFDSKTSGLGVCARIPAMIEERPRFKFLRLKSRFKSTISGSLS